MFTGTVKFWDPERGFGFLQSNANGPDMFCHVREVERASFTALVQGQRLRWNVGPNSRNGRDKAIDLELLPPVISPALQPTSFRDDRAESDEAFERADAMFSRVADRHGE
jgi:CspA family cold shock protein